MADFIEISWTSGSLEEARKVSRFLVQERYVACAQIVPWIESVYMWNNQLETSQESKILLKTRLENFNLIKQIIIDNCKYQVPEITFHSIEGGNEDYINWLQETIVSKNNLDQKTKKAL